MMLCLHHPDVQYFPISTSLLYTVLPTFFFFLNIQKIVSIIYYSYLSFCGTSQDL